MAEDLEAQLAYASWIPKLRREGDLPSVAATVPDAWFARAMPVIEKRR